MTRYGSERNHATTLDGTSAHCLGLGALSGHFAAARRAVAETNGALQPRSARGAVDPPSTVTSSQTESVCCGAAGRGGLEVPPSAGPESLPRDPPSVSSTPRLSLHPLRKPTSGRGKRGITST